MALSPQLLQFKSSGVYRLEFDKSQVSSISAETIRLVAGHSRKGPYNTPVYIEDTETFVLIFGGIDKKLEKKGMFFHRSCLEALKRGPILAMNLANFDSSDVASYARISTDGSDAAAQNVTGTDEFEKFHNTDKFMYPSDQDVLETVGYTGAFQNTALNLVNIGQNNLSVIVRQAQDLDKSFHVTAREWYGEGNIPDGIDEFDYISDYMVDVLVFQGKFEASAMDLDPVYGDYFTSTGLLKDKLVEFANERQVNLLAQYTGSIIPAFTDLEGNGLYIEQQINAEARRTGLFCAVNEDAVEEGKVDLIGETYDETQDYTVLSYNSDQNPQATYGADALVDTSTAGSVTPTTGQILIVDATPTDYSTDFDGKYIEAVGGGYLLVAATFDGVDTTTLTFSGDADVAVDAASIQTYIITSPAQGTRSIDMTAFGAVVSGSTVTFTGNAAFNLSVGDYLPAAASNKLARVTRISKAGNVYTVSCHRPVDAAYVSTVDALKSFESSSSEYEVFNFDKVSISEQSIQDCLTAFSSGGVKAALVDRDVIDLRYIVDTFASYEGGILNKNEFTRIAKERQNVSCILNAPTVEDFKKSTDPSFKDAFTGTFETRFVADGGDLSQNPTATYSLPSIADGANYGFYYGPGLNVRENGKVTVVPPAAYVSNNYIDKFTDSLPWSIVAGPRRGVVAGTNVIGAEYPFDKADRDNLEPFGYNPIVFERGVGLVIKGNKTAQQTIKSALSSAHVREVLIFIENGIADILKDYVFEFNTAQTRLEIKTLADSFMEGVLSDQGVYAFKNVMDQTNNTNEIIDNNMGILDTYVEPVKGLEIIVHRTTILNTGEIATGNF